MIIAVSFPIFKAIGKKKPEKKIRASASASTKMPKSALIFFSGFLFHYTGRYELNKLTSLPMCGFIAQLVEHRTGIAEVTDPVEALIFSGFFFPIA